MKEHLALAIATLSLLLSAAALVVRGTAAPSVGPSPVLPRARLPLAPSSRDLPVVECGPADAQLTLKGMMKTRINPAVTRLAFALYHDQEELSLRLANGAEASARLLSCIRQAQLLPNDGISLAQMPDYFSFLANLQENALALQVSAMEGDLEGSRHWFRHLKQDCVACHSRFRVEDTDVTP